MRHGSVPYLDSAVSWWGNKSGGKGATAAASLFDNFWILTQNMFSAYSVLNESTAKPLKSLLKVESFEFDRCDQYVSIYSIYKITIKRLCETFDCIMGGKKDKIKLHPDKSYGDKIYLNLDRIPKLLTAAACGYLKFEAT